MLGFPTSLHPIVYNVKFLVRTVPKVIPNDYHRLFRIDFGMNYDNHSAYPAPDTFGDVKGFTEAKFDLMK